MKDIKLFIIVLLLVIISGMCLWMSSLYNRIYEYDKCFNNMESIIDEIIGGNEIV